MRGDTRDLLPRGGRRQQLHRLVETDENRLRLDAVATEPSNDILVDIVLAKGGFKSGLGLRSFGLGAV